jgi:transposase InsO family protein
VFAEVGTSTTTQDAPTLPGTVATPSAGSSCTSVSTTTAGSPTPRYPPDEKATTAIGFLRRALAFFAHHGIRVQRLLTDNGSAYRSRVHALACRALGLRHLRTRPYRPQTNGKAERFIRTLLQGWAYGAIYGSSPERTAAHDGWL